MSRWRSSVYHLRTIPTAWSFVPSSLGFWNPIVVATNLRPTIRILFSSKSTNSPAHESKLEIQRFFFHWMTSFYIWLWLSQTQRPRQWNVFHHLHLHRVQLCGGGIYIHLQGRSPTVHFVKHQLTSPPPIHLLCGMLNWNRQQFIFSHILRWNI